MDGVKDSRSEHKSQNLNARLLRFRAQPESEDAYSLAEALLAAQRYADVRLVTGGAQSGSEDGALLVLEGRAWLQERDLVRAQAVLLRAVRAAPEHQPAYRWLGEVLLKRGDPQRAAKTLHRAIALDPEDAESAKLAARAEYLAEAANEGFETVPPDPDSAFDSEPAAKPRSVAPPAAQSGPGVRQRPPPQPSAASPLPPMPEVLRGRPATEASARPASTTHAKAAPPSAAAAPPVRSGEPGRSSFGARPPAKPYIAGNLDATRPRRGPGFHDPPTEPTSEFRRVPSKGPALPGPPAPARERPASSQGFPSAGRPPNLPSPPPAGGLPSLRGAALDAPKSLAHWRSGAPQPPAADPPPSAASSGPPPLGTRGSSPAGQPLDPRGSSRYQPEPPQRARQRFQPPVPQASFEPTSAQPRREPPSTQARSSRTEGPEVSAARASSAEGAAGARPRADVPEARGGAVGTAGVGAAARPRTDDARPPFGSELPSARPAGSGRPPEAGVAARSQARLAASVARQPPTEGSSSALDVTNGMATITSEPPPAPEAALGSQLGQPVDADDVLELMQRLGLFEAVDAAPAAWAPSSGVEARGQRLRNALFVVWGITLAACVAGYFGWNAFVSARHERAAQWVVQARALTMRGDHGALVDAERLLRLAREQHPALLDVPREALLVQVQRVLDDGERDMAALRTAYARARASNVTGPTLALGNALLSGASGEAAARDRGFAEVLAGAEGDARLVYLVGRAEQRAGRPDAFTHLQAAAQADSKLAPAHLAMAELAHENGDRAAALTSVDAALAADPQHLRAKLFRMYLVADDTDPERVQSSLATLGPVTEKAGSIDHALVALVRARLLRRQGKSDAAAAAVEAAGTAGAVEPRLLSLVAREALAVGKLTLAQHLASQALSAAPEVAQNRRLLARILIDRNDGEHALQLLEKMPADDIEAQVMKAQAALLSSDPAALKAALDGLAQVPATKRDLATRVGALRVRIEARLSPGKAVVDRARALARSAPGDPEALFALAEAALAAHDPVSAQNALKQRFAVSPDDPNGHCMLGRARRMSVDAAGAEASFRRALELAPGHGEAMVALAGLLLGQGKFAEADGVYQELATRGGSALVGRLGRADALTALARYDDAQVQLAAVAEAQQSSVGYRLSAARLALARNKTGDALALLRPLAEEQADKVQVMALYGDALCAAEQLDAADDAYGAALAIDTDLPEAVLGRADVLLRQARANDAIPLLQKAKEALSRRIRPPALEARRMMLLGRAYIARNKRGDADSGRDALREATALPGAPAEAFYFLAEALGGKANPEARTAYQRYLELEPRGKYRDRARRAVGNSP